MTEHSVPVNDVDEGTSRQKKVSVYLVAENRLLRGALAKLLQRKGDFRVCGTSSCMPNVLDSIARSEADVLILDSMTLRLSAFALIPEILRRVVDMKIVLIDMDSDPETFLECVRAGAVGYLLKEATAADIISGVRSVASGKAACSPELCMVLFQTVSHQLMSQPSARIKLELGLTRRQQQLVPLIADGLTNKEIASHLNLSEQTVKSHIHRMLRRVGANGRLEVIDLVRRQKSPVC